MLLTLLAAMVLAPYAYRRQAIARRCAAAARLEALGVEFESQFGSIRLNHRAASDEAYVGVKVTAPFKGSSSDRQLFCHFPFVARADFHEPTWNPRDLDFLSYWPRLYSLSLRGPLVDDKSLGTLENATSLLSLDLEGELTDGRVQALFSTLPKLKDVEARPYFARQFAACDRTSDGHTKLERVSGVGSISHISVSLMIDHFKAHHDIPILFDKTISRETADKSMFAGSLNLELDELLRRVVEPHGWMAVVQSKDILILPAEDAKKLPTVPWRTVWRRDSHGRVLVYRGLPVLMDTK